MTLRQIVDELGLQVISGVNNLEREITGGYAGDLLSDVMANSKEGNVWITIQRHQNVVAVASLKDLAGIIMANNREPEEEALKKAEEEGIPIMVSKLPAFEIAGRLYQLINYRKRSDVRCQVSGLALIPTLCVGMLLETLCVK